MRRREDHNGEDNNNQEGNEGEGNNALDCRNGRIDEELCYPIGYIKDSKYCSASLEFLDQSSSGECSNNFECNSNVCVSNSCVEEGLIKRILEWFKKVFS